MPVGAIAELVRGDVLYSEPACGRGAARLDLGSDHLFFLRRAPRGRPDRWSGKMGAWGGSVISN